MLRLIDLMDQDHVLRLLALQMAAYLKEAEMIGLTDVPPLFESPASIRRSEEVFYGLFRDSELDGAISLKLTGEGLRICRLMVHPDRLRQGIASLLLRRAIGEASARSVPLVVGTASANKAAVSLYSRFGFRPAARYQSANGLLMTEMIQPQPEG